MNSFFFENQNDASAERPLIVIDSENLNYLAHVHNEIEIVYIIKGEIDINCENQLFTAKKGDICIFMPGEIHSFNSVKSNYMKILKIYCKNSQEKISFSRCRLKSSLITNKNELYSILKAKTEEIISESKEKKAGYVFRTNGISQEILCFILRSGQISESDRETTRKQHFNIQILEKVNEYAEQNFSGKISLGDAAKYCNFSEYYFAHIFKNITGTTFYNYLTAYRLNKAASQLVYTDKKIIEIAIECGFSNIRSFNRTFKSQFGKTPGEYRKNGE